MHGSQNIKKKIDNSGGSILWSFMYFYDLSHTLLFIHSVVCLTTGPKPLPKPALHTVRSRASSYKWQYPLPSLRLSSSFLRLLPRLPVTSIPPLISPSITRSRRQFLRKMWTIQLAFRLLISCRIFLCSLTLSKTSSFLTWSIQLIFSILIVTSNKFWICQTRNICNVFIILCLIKNREPLTAPPIWKCHLPFWISGQFLSFPFLFSTDAILAELRETN